MELLRPTVFFSTKTISKAATIKARNATTAVFSSPPYFLFALSFSFVSVILRFIEPKTPAFSRLFTQMTANFDSLVFKTSARYTCTYIP